MVEVGDARTTSTNHHLHITIHFGTNDRQFAIDCAQLLLFFVAIAPPPERRGPQMVAAMETCREIRKLRPQVKIVWGGYFPSLYPDTTLNAKYVDYVVRGQGEDTLLELIDGEEEYVVEKILKSRMF